MWLKLPFNKVSEVIDWDGRAHQTVASKYVIDNRCTVVLKERTQSVEYYFTFTKQLFPPSCKTNEHGLIPSSHSPTHNH